MKSALAKAGRYTIEQENCPPTGPVDLKRPRTGVLHTTEGSFESAYNEFKKKYAPHFLVGKDRSGKVRIVQFVSLGNYAAALENHSGGVETNRWAVVQIEVAGYSKTTPWMFDDDVKDALASLMATLVKEAGIPLARPFPDKMPTLPWATPSFQRRKAAKWGRVAGWYGHVEVPENGHWDPGALKWSELLAAARAKLSTAPKPAPKPTPAPPQVPAPVTVVVDLSKVSDADLLDELRKRLAAR